jgi:hypothetical protein
MNAILYIVIHLSLFVLFYDPTLVYTNTGLARVISLVSVMFALVILVNAKRYKLKVNILLLISILSLLLVMSVLQLIAFLNGMDSYYSNYIFSALTVFIPFTLSLCIYVNYLNISYLRFFEIISNICFLQSVFLLIDWFFTENDSSIFSNFIVVPTSTIGTYRVAGLSSIGGDGLSFVQYIGFSISFHLYFYRDLKYKSKKRYLFYSILILFTLILVARTGVVLSLIFAVMYLLFTRGFFNLFRYISMIFISLAILFGLFTLISSESRMDVIYLELMPHAFELYYNIYESGSFQTGSTKLLLGDMIFFPDNFMTWTFGDGYWRSPYGEGNYIDSDNGYIRLLYYSGVFGSFLIYFWLICNYVFLFLKFKDTSTRKFFICFLITLFIAHMKYPFILSSVSIFLVFTFLAMKSKPNYHLIVKERFYT